MRSHNARDILQSYWVVLLSPFLLLAPIFLKGQVLFWGTPSLQFVSWWSFAVSSLKQGVLPLWNPLNGFGAPLLANYQSAFFYPPNWLLIFAGWESGAVGIAIGFSLLAALHLAWAGLGMAVLLGRLQFSRFACMVGGITFALSGYLVARLGFFSIIWAAAWIPWVILCADSISSPHSGYTKDKWYHLSFGLVGCIALQLLAGHAQITWYTMLLVATWVTAGGIRQKSFRCLLAGWARLALATAAAAGIAAVQLVPTFEYLQNSQRTDAYAYAEAVVYSFWPWRFLTIFSPDFFGSPAQGDYWGYASHWEDHLYLGLMPVLLALSSLVVFFRNKKSEENRERRFLVILCWLLIVIGFVLALGNNTPVFPFLYWWIPTFDMFQAPSRYLIWVTFALIILAAYGVDHWRCPVGKGLYWLRLATAGALAITLGAGATRLFLNSVQLTFIRSASMTGMWGAGFGLLTLLLPAAEKKGHRVLWEVAVTVVILADLLLTGWDLNPGVSVDFYAQIPTAQRANAEIEPGGRIYIQTEDGFDLKFRRFLRFDDFRPLEDWKGMREVFIPNLNLLEGIALASNFDPLVPERYSRWIHQIDLMVPAVKEAWLGLAGVVAIERIDRTQPSGIRLDSISGALRWKWHGCSREVATANEAWLELTQDFLTEPLSDRSVIVETGRSDFIENCIHGKSAEIELISQYPDQVILKVNALTDGWLQLMDTWYPGWVVTVSGEKKILYPADYLFKAVHVKNGSHIVVISYRPTRFYFGGLFSILVLLYVIFLRIRRRMR